MCSSEVSFLTIVAWIIKIVIALNLLLKVLIRFVPSQLMTRRNKFFHRLVRARPPGPVQRPSSFCVSIQRYRAQSVQHWHTI